jgi:ribulose-5-phosphate 4-epimerase/fuculose-1-phosphate aldolase
MNNNAMSSTSIRSQVSEEEWAIRVELAACYRIVARYGMSDLVYNHITAKVPGTDHFLINPFGMLYTQVTASSLYKIDLKGNVILQPDTPYGVNRAGFAIHSGIHGGRPDLVCVYHAHTRAGMAVASMKCGLLPLSQPSTRFYGHIGYHDFEVPTANVSEGERLVRDLGTYDAMILRNHGLLTAGPTVAEAFNLMYWLDQTCKVQVDAMASGTELTMIPPEIAIKAGERYRKYGPPALGLLGWDALLQELDRADPSYKV